MLSHRILCVDPDEDAREETIAELRDELTDIDPEVHGTGSLADAKEQLNQKTDMVITEYDFPDGTGFDLIVEARDICPDAGFVLYTDTDPDTIDTSALRGTIAEYVGKGSVFGTERLARLVRTTLESRTQATYPLPQNEDERLAALRSYDLDDPELDESLRQISDLAAEYFDVDIASINIINEHSQEFLACYGETSEWDTMDREDSICTFTILEESDLMVVEDVTEDPRFESRSEALVDLGIQSYMGANLVTPSGLVIGPLCIYDDEPRSFSPDEQEYLRTLASVAMDIIELHSQREMAAADGGQP